MRLSETQKHWDEFARTDPLWAVLTVDGKQNNRWDADEFFRTGVATIEAELRRVREDAPDLRHAAALDFGCGVGRLTQALAAHFDRVTGVDIAPRMLDLARQFNRHGDRVEYLLNERDDLRLLPDDRYDLVYSLITLQHVAPAYARRYIAEFVRVAAPGGVILFQVPSEGARQHPRTRRPFTLWPDTLVKRFIRDWRRRRMHSGPIMEMNALPPAEVVAILERAGARVLRQFRYDAAGPELASWGYLARKV